MSWHDELAAHALAGTLICVGLALVILILRRLARASRIERRLDTALAVLAVGLLAGALTELTRILHLAAIRPYFEALFFVAVAVGLTHAALTLFVDHYLLQRKGAVVSALFRDVAGIFVDFMVIVVVLRSTLDINLASVVATSAVLTAIIGLALQDLLGNLFSGIVLELEASFSRGDWVRIGTFEGTIVQTGWRTTQLRTRVNELVVLPNAMLSKEPIVNFSRPQPLVGDTLHFEAAYEAPPSIVKRAAVSVAEAEPAVARSPRPEVWLARYGDSGIGYAIRYWITDFAELERIRSRILSNLWYTLNRAGVRFPFPARDVFVYQGTAPTLQPETVDVIGLLRSAPLLGPLSDSALAQLAPRLRRLRFGAGETVVREGDPGDSFYIVERGEAEVLLGGERGQDVVGRIAAGGFFGEMSLLMGEVRTATVRAQSDLSLLMIDRAAFREVIAADPALLGPLSEAAARRLVEQRKHREAADAREPVVRAEQVQRLRERIRGFFGL
jgi:small-conductance mechanosensitive channel/CRP-like cAMP-binding protein